VPGWWPHQRLIVLADTVPAKDGGHRAVPLWLIAGHKELLGRLGQPAGDAEVATGLLETTVRLLRTAGTQVSAVDIEPASDDVPELRSDTVSARVDLATAAGSRPVTVGAEYGLALAAVAGAPVRVADAVMDRLAVPVPGEDVLAPFLPPADARPAGRRARRFEPRNMAFTDGLDYWELAGSFSADGQPAGPDYSCASADQSAFLAATVTEPVGSAVLVQAIAAEDYRGAAVTFRGQLRATGIAGQAGLHLAVSRPPSPAVQDAFLQAFLALDRLRDPDRFAGWLGGIVANVCRAQRRRAPLTLLGDWPENLHPASAGPLPSAEDLDRADVLGRAVAGLPPGQRQAVTLFYYADQPAGQVAVTPGAAKASLHKARRRLREYITAHRPDLIPAVSRRIPVTAVRIAHADPWPGRTPDGGMDVRHVLVILADDAGHRVLPVQLPGPERQLWRLLSRPDDLREEDPLSGHTEEMTGRLLQAAGVTLAGVTVTDLGPGVTATRIDIAGAGGTRPVTASLADGLSLAVIAGAPLTVDDPVMDRLARPVTGPDLLSQFRSQETSPRLLSRRFEPRNMAFTEGLDRWQLGGTFLRQGTGFDYAAAAGDGRAILAAAGPEPAGFAFLAQEIDADDYRGRTVTFRGELRSAAADGRAGLALRAASPGRPAPPQPASSDPWENPANHIAFATRTGAWTQYEVTAQVPADASLIRFGVFLNGGGQLEFRHPVIQNA
jgi:bifunctional DNase/RNase